VKWEVELVGWELQLAVDPEFGPLVVDHSARKVALEEWEGVLGELGVEGLG